MARTKVAMSSCEASPSIRRRRSLEAMFWPARGVVMDISMKPRNASHSSACLVSRLNTIQQHSASQPDIIHRSSAPGQMIFISV